MTVARTVADLRAALSGRQRPVGFIPTMGALHPGHLALCEAAVSECPTTVCSIYVNPTQFGPNEDFASYPRVEADDLALLEQAGVTVAFLPTDAEVYRGQDTMVRVVGAAEGFEGAHRPGHFDGVATVVAKLFLMTGCDVAYFGLKDLQQCAVVRQMARDLCFAVELRFLETVREESGLALSSRNRYFNKEQAELASLFSRTLRLTCDAISSGTSVLDACRQGQENLTALGFQPDYLDLVDPETMRPLENPLKGARLVAAAKLFGVRLIDNVPLEQDSSA